MVTGVKGLVAFLKRIGVMNTVDLVLWLAYLVGCLVVAAITFVRGEAHCAGYALIAGAVAGHAALIVVRLLVWCWKREAERRLKKKFRKVWRRLTARLGRGAGMTAGTVAKRSTPWRV